MPSPSSIWRSISTTSGRSARHSVTASAPDAASPTTRSAGSELDRSARDAGPGHRVVVDHQHPDGMRRGRVERVRGLGRRAGSTRGSGSPSPGVESSSSVPPSSRARSAIPPSPRPCARSVLVDRALVEPGAVVLDEQRDAGRRVDEPDAHGRGPRVPDRVRERLLRDPEQRVRDVRRRHAPGLPAVTRRASITPVRFAHASSSSSASSSERPSSGEGARPSTLRRVSSKTASAAVRASASASVASSGRPSAIAPWAARSCSSTETSPWATASCTSRAIRLRSAAAASARAFDSAASCRRAFVIAMAACFANSSSSSASSSTNARFGVAGEHHQRADDLARATRSGRRSRP